MGPVFKNTTNVTFNDILLLFAFREFTLAEIEHFVDPCDKNHPKFENVSSQKVTLYPSENQIEGKPTVNISLGDAVNQVSGNLSHGFSLVARGTLSRNSFSMSCRALDMPHILIMYYAIHFCYMERSYGNVCCFKNSVYTYNTVN